MNVIERRVI